MDELYFVELEETFSTPGWRRIVREAEEALAQRKEQALAANSVEELFFYKGEAQQLAILTSLEASTALLRAQSEEGEE